MEGFRQGLRELGYVEGKNIIIEWRSAEGKPERRNDIAADWARLKVDIIVTGGPTTTFAAKEATSTIPIAMAFDNDPVGNGFVASLARPEGNIIRLFTLAPEISGKQNEPLKEVVPRALPRCRPWVFDHAGQRAIFERDGTRRWGARSAASILRRTDPKDIETLFRAASKGRADFLSC